MKVWLGPILLAVLALSAAPAADNAKVTYYVHLVRGSNGEKPPLEAKPIGEKLSKRLRPVFNWQSYWEINRQRIELAQGQKAKVRLSKEREAEIDLMHPGKRIITAYEAGKPVSRITRPIGEGMTIMGGNRDSKSVWFIIVRRDNPAN